MDIRKNTLKPYSVYIVISYLLIIVTVCIRVFSFRFGVLDELWEYDFSRAITMGYLPYRDFPDCSMPLFGFIFSIPLFFSRTLFAYRVMTATFFTVLFITLFNTIKRKTSARYAICTVLFGIRFAELATYNMLMVLWAVLALNALRIKNPKFRYFLVGLFTALSPLSKQSSGSIMLILITVLMVVHIFRSREPRILLGYYVAGVFIPCFIFLSYLLVTSSFNAFWDCCFWGLVKYADNNTSINLDGSFAMLLIIACGIAADCYFIIRKKEFEAGFHLCAGIALLTNAIPIFEYYHLVMAGIFFLIPIAAIIKEFAPRIISINLTPIIVSMITVIIIVFSIDVFINPGLSNQWPELALIPSAEDVDTFDVIIRTNNKYEASGKNVVIFSSSCVVMSIAEGKFRSPYDFFLNGNMGTSDPMSYVEDACSDSDNIILIPTNYDDENWQNPDGIYDYVLSHCTPVASYGDWIWYATVQ